MADSEQHAQVPAGTVLLPAPTAWPLVLALGLALSFAGLVTSYSITLLGACRRDRRHHRLDAPGISG